MNMDLFSQFLLKTLFQFSILGFQITITNGTVYMLGIIVSVYFLFGFGFRDPKLIPNKFQSLVESILNFTVKICKENLGEKHYLSYAPFLTAIFLFVLFANLFGMIPYFGFTITSHVSVCLMLALIVWGYSILLGFYLHGFGFFNLFLPSGVSPYILPLIALIEMISFLFRPITLTVRLVANMLAGHVLFKVFAYLTLGMLSSYLFILSFLPYCLMLVFVPLELFVAFIQAYIFFLLSVFYLKDAIHLH